MNGRRLLAIMLILFGGVMLADNIIPGGVGNLFWPALLIIVGLVLIFRPEIMGSEGVKFRPIADVSHRGNFEAADEEYRMFVGDVNMDYTEATMPEGVTRVRISAFVPDIDLNVPKDVGLRIITNAFVTDRKMNGESKSYVMTGMRFTSDNFKDASKKLDVEINCFVADLTVRYE